jgi:hypothetical protein
MSFIGILKLAFWNSKFPEPSYDQLCIKTMILMKKALEKLYGELLLQSADWLGRQLFSRSNEYQADAKCWELLTLSQRYNPQTLKSLLEKLWDFRGRQDGKTSWQSIRERWITLERWKKSGMYCPIQNNERD